MVQEPLGFDGFEPECMSGLRNTFFPWVWQLQRNKRLLFREAAAQQVTAHSRQRGALKLLCQEMGVFQKR